MGSQSTNESAQQSNEPMELDDFIPKPLIAPIGQPPESKLGARVQVARNHFGLSVDALSRLTKATDTHESRGVSATALLRYEAGDALPGARELRLLCESLGVSADWLVTGNVATGLDVAETEFLSAVSNLSRFYAGRSALGDELTIAPKQMERMQRSKRISDAKRRV